MEKKEKRAFAVSPSIIFSLITAQAGSFAKGLLECIMNSVDAGATEVSVVFDERGYRISDNGRGFQSRDEIEQYFEVFGFDHENDKHQGQRVYGQFGIGRAQLWAFSSNTWRTNVFEMHVDIKNKGLDYDFIEVSKPVPGVTIQGTHYEQMSIRDVINTERDLTDLAKYAPIKLTVNNKLISIDPTKEKWTHETDDAWVKLVPSGDLEVYNLGVLVRRYPGYVIGSGGVVVTKPGVRLALNMARNDVLTSQCHVWKRIKPFLEKKAEQVQRAKKRTSEEVEESRTHLALKLLAGDCTSGEVHSEKLITTVDGRHLTIATLAQAAVPLVVAPRNDRAAGKQHEAKVCVAISEETLTRFRATSLKELLSMLSNALKPIAPYYSRALGQCRTGESLKELGLDISTDYEVVADKQLTPREMCALRAIRFINALGTVQSAVYHQTGAPVRTRTIHAGHSEIAWAWTNGATSIWINRSVLSKASTGLQGFMMIIGLLVHEYTHNEADSGSHTHSETFYQTVESILVTNAKVQQSVVECLAKYVKCCNEKGVRLGKRLLLNCEAVTNGEDEPVVEEVCQPVKLPEIRRATGEALAAKKKPKNALGPRVEDNSQLKLFG